MIFHLNNLFYYLTLLQVANRGRLRLEKPQLFESDVVGICHVCNALCPLYAIFAHFIYILTYYTNYSSNYRYESHKWICQKKSKKNRKTSVSWVSAKRFSWPKCTNLRDFFVFIIWCERIDVWRRWMGVVSIYLQDACECMVSRSLPHPHIILIRFTFIQFTVLLQFHTHASSIVRLLTHITHHSQIHIHTHAHTHTHRVFNFVHINNNNSSSRQSAQSTQWPCQFCEFFVSIYCVWFFFFSFSCGVCICEFIFSIKQLSESK